MAESPVRYEIRVRGLLSETLLGAFEGLHAEAQGAETVLVPFSALERGHRSPE